MRGKMFCVYVVVCGWVVLYEGVCFTYWWKYVWNTYKCKINMCMNVLYTVDKIIDWLISYCAQSKIKGDIDWLAHVCHFLLCLCVCCRSMSSLCWSRRMTYQGRWPAVSSITVCLCLWPCSPPSCPSSLRSCGRDSNHSDLELLPTPACVYNRTPARLNW